MTQKKPPQKIGSLKLEPLKSRHFDMKPAEMGRKGFVLSWMKDYQRFAGITILIFLFFIFVIVYVQGKNILHASQKLAFSGYEDLKEGVDHLLNEDTNRASQAFQKAQKTFMTLEDSTSFLTQNANRLADKKLYLNTAGTLVEVALSVTEMGKKLTHLAESAPVFLKDIFSPAEGEMIGLMHEKKQELDELISQASRIQQGLTTIKLSVLPEDFQMSIKTAQSQIGDFLSVLSAFRNDFESILTLLGDRVPHRYLILFQNNHEIRATGGFIGSYMIMEVNDGKIIKTDAKDVYESDGQLAEYLDSPPGIERLSKRFYMRDANYSPDFPTSAEKIMWFLENSKGPSVDTVVAIDQTLIEEVLKITGPLGSVNLPFELNATNFNRFISFYTEAKLSDGDTPKQLLFDLIPAFKEKLSRFEHLPAVAALFKEMIKEGHLQLYSKDEMIQSLSEKYGLAGRVIRPAEKTDYLSVISTSVGANKSDEFIESEFTHTTLVDQKGGITNELALKKTHTYSAQNRRQVEDLIARFGPGKRSPEELHGILGGGDNLDYMRVYVPLGSELQAATGVDIERVTISEELGYTVFAFLFGPVKAGDEKTIRLRYKLPYHLSFRPMDSYRFIAQRQAGAENIYFTKAIQAANPLMIKKTYPNFLSPSVYAPVIDEIFDDVKFFIAAIVKE